MAKYHFSLFRQKNFVGEPNSSLDKLILMFNNQLAKGSVNVITNVIFVSVSNVISPIISLLDSII